jgi:YidC/Oxa1 family membrane protein insertase
MMPAPDPNDEQAVMQHKVMTYMMIFMGLMFFKVASGLCIYFIASSLWSLAERKLLPKPVPKGGDSNVIDVTPTSSNGSDRKKNRDRR